jgi:hypothetical protein
MTTSRAAVDELGGLDERQLYALLGMRLKAIERDPAKAGQFAPDLTGAQEVGITAADLGDFGRQAFGSLAKLGHTVVCGQNAEGIHMQRILDAMGSDVGTATAVVATILIAQLAIAPAIAGIVATIVVGKVAPSSLEVLCRNWSAKIEPAATEPPPDIPPSEPLAEPPQQPEPEIAPQAQAATPRG